MANNRWIEIASSDAPAVEVAAVVLAERVKRVKRMLPLAAWEHEQDVEHVHQLRTSCRRAAAALQAFRPLMSRKPKKLGRLLRRFRTAAGPARDADVLYDRFCEELSEDAHLDYVLARLQVSRASAQAGLVAVAEIARSGRLRKALKRTCKSLSEGARDEQRLSFRQFARSALSSASQPFFQWTTVEQPSLSQLHQLRIAGKRLRYSIELFHQAFPEEMRTEVYPQIEQLQERLGQLNDHATAQALFQRWIAGMPAGERAANLAGGIVQQYKAARQTRQEFLRWWTTKRVVRLETQLGTLLQTEG